MQRDRSDTRQGIDSDSENQFAVWLFSPADVADAVANYQDRLP
jgi:hypothetical protein